MKNKILSALFFVFVICLPLHSQEVMKLDLDQVIELAETQSPDAILAKHRFRQDYWSFRTFKARYLPSLSLSGTLPDYNRVYEKEYDFQTQQENYVEKNTNNSSLTMSLRQNIGLTGGSIFMRSDLRRFDVLGEDASNQYITTPVSIGLSQPLFNYNDLKWEKKIEPKKYEKAQRDYLSRMEQVHLRAVNLFFNLATAQMNKEIAEVNYSNADTLYQIAQGRYNIGTIAEDELLQMELRFMNASTARNDANIRLRSNELALRSFLGYNENVFLELEVPYEVPEMEVGVDQAIELAKQNNPDILSWDISLLEAAQSVARAKSQRGLNATLNASYGLTQRANDLPGAYREPDNQQTLRIGFEIPILDWGLMKGQHQMAMSAEEVVKTQVMQQQIEFEQNVFLEIAQFNIQDDQVRIAKKSEEIAQKRYDVTKQRFLIGKIDVLDLNVADTEKDTAKRGYIQSLQNFWQYYYQVRQLTLYDFENDSMLDTDWDKLTE